MVVMSSSIFYLGVIRFLAHNGQSQGMSVDKQRLSVTGTFLLSLPHSLTPSLPLILSSRVPSVYPFPLSLPVYSIFNDVGMLCLSGVFKSTATGCSLGWFTKLPVPTTKAALEVGAA